MNDDQIRNVLWMVLLAAAMLLILSSLADAEEPQEDSRLPTAGFCSQDPQSTQEIRFCKMFISAMHKDKRMREAAPPEPAMIWHVIVVEDSDCETVAYSAVILLHTPNLAGFSPIVWQKAGVVEYSCFKKEFEEMLDMGMTAIVNWLPGALEASRNLCPDERDGYKSVGLCDYHESEGEFVDGADMNYFEAQ